MSCILPRVRLRVVPSFAVSLCSRMCASLAPIIFSSFTLSHAVDSVSQQGMLLAVVLVIASQSLATASQFAPLSDGCCCWSSLWSFLVSICRILAFSLGCSSTAFDPNESGISSAHQSIHSDECHLVGCFCRLDVQKTPLGFVPSLRIWSVRRRRSSKLASWLVRCTCVVIVSWCLWGLFAHCGWLGTGQ